MSAVIEFLSIIYQETNSTSGHSWRVLNEAMANGLSLAIKARFKFEPEDFQEVAKWFKFEYWGGLDPLGNGYGESFYALAVESGNTSACISFEKYKERSPFIYQGKRLAIGSQFSLVDDEFEVRVWRVNSFNESGTKINCGYYVSNVDSKYHELKLESRLSLTKKELKAQEKRFKEASVGRTRIQQDRYQSQLELEQAIKSGIPRRGDVVMSSR